MKFNQWTLGLAAVGVISLGSAIQAEEAQQAVMTALSSTTISGYVNTSANLRFGHSRSDNTYATGDRNNQFVSNGKSNGFNLDVAKLQLEKPLDESQWSAGYQLGLLFGPDANSYNTTSSIGGNDSDFGIKDANVTLRTPVGNGLDFKLGYWESPIGYEVFDAGNNPNYSRSYAYSIEPKQFTGLLATYRVSEVISFSGGIANRSWDLYSAYYGSRTTVYEGNNAINERSDGKTIFTYLGSVAITAPEGAGFLKGATLYGGVIDSGVDGGPDPLNLYVGGTMPTPLNGVLLGASYDYRGTSADEDNGWASSHANALSGYLSWQITEKLKLNGRFEYATGSNYTWYLGYADEDNELVAATATVDYNLWANVLTRLEFRWDHELGSNQIFNDYVPFSGSALASENGCYHGHEGTSNAFLLALNVIYKF